mmetsp:Transcript_4511/g.6591  ORF Transcript_4511/g.6591 Transcript_4511/m.6591 type:complete len:115 (-) Transcript_4511:10-354(-)
MIQNSKHLLNSISSPFALLLYHDVLNVVKSTKPIAHQQVLPIQKHLLNKKITMHFVAEQQYWVSQLRYLSGMLCIIIPIVRLMLSDSSADAATAGCCRRLQECQQKRSHKIILI